MVSVKFFATKYALKSIARRPKKNIAAIFSVMVSVSLLVGVSAGSNGLQNAFGAAWWLSHGESDISAYNTGFPFMPENYTELIINSNDPRLSDLNAISASIDYDGQVMYADGIIDNNVNIIGIHTEQLEFGQFYDLDGNVLDIKVLLSNDLQNPTLIISKTMAGKMNISEGAVLISSIPDGQGGKVPLVAEVVAIYDDEVGRGIEYTVNPYSRVYLHLDQLQKRLVAEFQDYITLFRINLKTLDQGGKVSRDLADLDVDAKSFPGIDAIRNAADAIQDILNEENPNIIVTSSRVISAESIKDIIDGIRAVLNLFVVLLTSTALLLIVNVQSMSFDDRRYQTAVLRAMGSSRMQIFRIFIIESSVVGVIGSLIGLFAGIFYGDFIQTTINDIFEIPGNPQGSLIDNSTVISAFLFGTLLSMATAAVPAYRVSGQSITNELRGITAPKMEGKGYRTILLGLVLIGVGLNMAQSVGEFWKKEAWNTFENMTDIMLGIGLTLGGIGLFLTLFIPRRLALNVSALSFWGFANFTMFVAIDWVKEGDGSSFFMVLLFFLIIGTTLIIVVNFESIMRLLNRIFFIFPSTRGISQVTSTGLIGRKGRASLVFSIFTIILVLNVFISSASYTMQTSLVDGYEWRTYGNDILVNTVTPSTDIIDEIMSIDGVEQVFSFRSAWNPVFYDYPSPDNADFDINDAIRMRYIIEITPQTLNPSGDWGGDSYPISFEAINDKVGYDWSLDATPPQHKDLSIDIIDDIFENRTLAQTINYKSENGSNVAISMEQYTVLGGFFADTDQDVYIQGKNSENPIISMKRVTRSIDFLGPCDGFGCSIMISPKIADQLEIFDYITEPNLFLVKTSNAYKDKDNNLLVSQLIGKRLNDLDDPTSLSSEKGILIGATTRVIYTVIKDFWGTQAAFWDFLATFAVMGLIIGSAGMIIIAIRSVSERIREIGMMRAIGFSKKAVIYSVIYEMVTLALLGLSTGILNGILLTEMFTNKMMLVESAYPTNLLILYSVLVVGVSLIAAIIPGYRASQVPPSSALRYNG